VAWTLRYASHLGYGAVGRPLFHESAASPDPEAQVAFAASLGFAGVQFANAVARPAEERARVRRALERHGLETGCIVYAQRDVAMQPLWGTRDASARDVRERALLDGFAVADEVNARHVVVLSGVDTTIPIALQHTALIENLKRAAELAARYDKIICLESVSRTVRPTLLQHIGDAYTVVRAVDNPHVRLIFDTAHVQLMDGDLLMNLRATYDAISLVQLADNPGRLEPGTGEINFARILAELRLLDYRGVVELEYNWSTPTRACEQAGIEQLRALDAAK
jgi:hydroxypyruvate isomerase